MNNEGIITLNNTKNYVAEAYRMLRTNLYYTNLDNNLKSILVTSPSVSDGKTTTAVNLSVILGQAGSKVLLIGADLRKPKALKMLGIEKGLGLTQVLSNVVKLDEAIMAHEEVEGLCFLQAGSIPPNPSEMIQSKGMEDLLNELREKFDYIIIDAPPVNLVSDSLILAKIVDGVLLVVAEKTTKKDLSKQAIEQLRGIDANVLGTVVTKCKNKAYYYSY